MAAPQILQVTVAAAQAVALVGMPEARIILAEATIAVATAPKSNASYNAINQALADVDTGKIGAVPLYLRNAPTKLMKEWATTRATNMRTIGPVRGATGIYARRAAWHRVLPSQRSRL